MFGDLDYCSYLCPQIIHYVIKLRYEEREDFQSRDGSDNHVRLAGKCDGNRNDVEGEDCGRGHRGSQEVGATDAAWS